MCWKALEKVFRSKIFSFSAHIRVDKFDLDQSFEDTPVPVTSIIYQNAESLPTVRHIQSYIFKPALLKTNEEVQGVVIKGMGKDMDTAAFAINMVRGQLPAFGRDSSQLNCLISQRMANWLHLDTGQRVLTFFLQDPPRYRKLTVAGIYETGLEDFDESIILADIRLLQTLNNWGDTLVGGFEIFTKNAEPEALSTAFDEVFEAMDYNLNAEKITDTYIQLFDWLRMLDRNVQVLVVLIMVVASFNVISTLLIMILERTQMIGVLQALGMPPPQIRQIFVINGLLILARGLFLGNLLGLGLAALQYTFELIPLDAKNYYMNTVPIEWNWWYILLINLIMIGITAFTLLIPTAVVMRIKPVTAIRFN